jgi:hypothetical protein
MRNVLCYPLHIIGDPRFGQFFRGETRNHRGGTSGNADLNAKGRVPLGNDPVGSSCVRMFFRHVPNMGRGWPNTNTALGRGRLQRPYYLAEVQDAPIAPLPFRRAWRSPARLCRRFVRKASPGKATGCIFGPSFPHCLSSPTRSCKQCQFVQFICDTVLQGNAGIGLSVNAVVDPVPGTFIAGREGTGSSRASAGQRPVRMAACRSGTAGSRAQGRVPQYRKRG